MKTYGLEQERRKARQLLVVSAALTIKRRSTALTNEQRSDEIRVVALAANAEMRAVWAFLKDRGFVSEEEYQDYLDKGYHSLLEQIEGKAAEILEPGR